MEWYRSCFGSELDESRVMATVKSREWFVYYYSVVFCSVGHDSHLELGIIGFFLVLL